MSKLQFMIVIVSIIFMFFSLDLFKRKKANMIHFLTFGIGCIAILIFTFVPNLLNNFGRFFGVDRGSILLVYIAIIALSYFYFELLHKIFRQSTETTNLARYLCISHATGNIDKSKKIIFIIPAYNEDKTAIGVIQKIIDVGHGIVYIDDGSNQINMIPILSQKFTNQNIIFLQHPINLGQGAALQTGGEFVLQKLPQAQFVVHFDSDGQHRLEDFDKFIKKFKQNPDLDIVIGSRFLGENSIGMSNWRKINKKLQILFMRFFVGLELTDTHNGYRVISTKVLDKIQITLNRMAHASEIEQIIKDQGLKYAEVPIKVLYTEYSVKKGQKLTNAFKIAADFIYRKFFFR